MNELTMSTKVKMDKVIEHLASELSKVRTGRVNPNMLSGITIIAYDVDTPLNQAATITVAGARQLKISPFDKKNIEAIETAINKANLGIAPVNNGESIILNIPPLTDDTRQSYAREVKKNGEAEKISIRNLRRDANEHIKKSDLQENLKKLLEDEIQNLTNVYNQKIDEMIKAKVTEVTNI